MNGSVKVENVSWETIGVMVVTRIAMMDQMKLIVVSKKIQIKRLHVYHS